MALSSASYRKKQSEGAQVGVLRIPKGTEKFAVKAAGQIRMVILPYTVPVGAKHPVAKPGELHYARDYYIHQNFGASGKEYAVCPRLTNGDKCPICEAIKDQLASGQITKEQAKTLNAKQRTLYNVWLPDENKVAIFDTSFHTFTKPLNTVVAANVNIPGLEYADYFADPVDGSFIYATFIEKPLPSTKFYELVSAIFQKHNGVPAEVLAKALPLDDLLVIESYASLKGRFWDMDVVDDEPSQDHAENVPSIVVTSPSVAMPINTTMPPAPVEIPAPASAPATKAKADTPEWAQKGCTVYHRKLGKCSVLKNQDGVITVLDASDDPHKAKLADLAAKPFPEVKKEPESPEPVAVSETEENGAWDDWDD